MNKKTVHYIKNKIYINIFLLIFVFFIGQNPAYSGAWLQKYKRLEVINNISLGSEVMLSLAIENPNPETGLPSVASVNYNLYLEYGLTKNNTIGINTMFSFYDVNYHDDDIPNGKSYGMPFTEIFYRIKIFQYKNFIFSLEPRVKLPSVKPNDDLSKNLFKYNKSPDIEIKANFGVSFQMEEPTGILVSNGEKGIFMSSSISYRHRFELDLAELKIEAVLGVHISKYFSTIVEFQKTFTLNNIYDPGESIDIFSYHIGKLILYLVSNLNESISIVAGLAIDIASNTESNIPVIGSYSGSGVNIGVWLKV